MDEELRQLLVGISTRLAAMEERLPAMEERLIQYTDKRSEKVETNLLTAFHGWARSMEIRVRGSSTIVSGFDERLTFLEDRVSDLERKKAS